MRIYCGLDVHCKKTFWAIQNEEGDLLAEDCCESTAEGILTMIEKHKIPSGSAVALESGNLAAWFCQTLTAAGLSPVVLNPAEVRAKARRRGQKSDRRDAFEICDGLRRGIYVSRVWMPSSDLARLRRVLSRRRHFVAVRTMQVNAAKHLLRGQGVSGAMPHLKSARTWRRLLERPEAREVGEELVLHFEMWELAQRHVGALDKALRAALEPFMETADLLRSAPGVGPITAASFIAAVGDPERFPDSGRLASYVGLVPSTYDTGDRERHGKITKSGSPYLRAALCEAAQHARKPQHPLNPYFARVKGKSGYKRAIVAVAHRLARILWRMWRDDAPFDPRRLNVRWEPRDQMWTTFWRIKEAVG